MNVTLKKWEMQDKQALMEICNKMDRTYLSGRIPCPYTEADAEFWILHTQQEEEKSGIFRAIVADGKIVGNISVEKGTSTIYTKTAEIGYSLRPQFSSKGIMTKAAEQICELAFEKLPITRITGLVFAPNIASRKVLEKNGFELEGIVKQVVCKEENCYDLCIYGKLKK